MAHKASHRITEDTVMDDKGNWAGPGDRIQLRAAVNSRGKDCRAYQTLESANATVIPAVMIHGVQVPVVQ